MSVWSQFLVVAIGTLVFRASFVLAMATTRLSRKTERGLRLIAPAVLAGLVAQGLFVEAAEWRPLGSWHVAAAVALLVGWRRRSVTQTLLAGVGALWLLEVLF